MSEDNNVVDINQPAEQPEKEIVYVHACGVCTGKEFLLHAEGGRLQCSQCKTILKNCHLEEGPPEPA
jgi:hypothetical protein